MAIFTQNLWRLMTYDIINLIDKPLYFRNYLIDLIDLIDLIYLIY